MHAPDKLQLKYFLFSQYLADGIRVTLEIILPVIFFAQFEQMNMGLIIALGAFCASISDIPGPVESKRNGILYCIGFIFLMSLLTGFLNQHIFLLGILIAVSSFFFTMIGVFGNRASSIGTAALLVLILRMSDLETTQQTITNSLLILAGAVWYLIIALIFYRLTPFRAAQRALGDCIHETAKFLKIKSNLYNTTLDYEEEYRKLLSQQIVVNEKQDAVRELLFKNPEMLKEHSKPARMLVISFADSIDLFEQIMATWYDYKSLRQRFGPSGILDDVSLVIKNLAEELDRIGLAIQSNSHYKKQHELIPDLDKLKIKVDELNEKNGSNLVLKKIIVNLRNLGEYVDELVHYFSISNSRKKRKRNVSDYSKFVTHQEISLNILRNNFTPKSGIFRHSLRMMITCLAGFIIAKLLPNAHHSYWILLTIIILLKPGFSLTKERNIQRFAGTLAGGIIGLFILHFIHDRNILFGLIVFFMLGTYTFMRLNYIVMVIFTTPYILILFNLLGLGLLNVAEERLLDTGIACILSFLASYLLFPHWEKVQIDSFMKQVLKANINYLQKLFLFFSGYPIPPLEYKLARKELYISTANLSAAFNRMLSEPKHKQANGKLIYEFVVLNHVLSSNIASLSADILITEQNPYPRNVLQQVNRSVHNLEDSLTLLDKDFETQIIAHIPAKPALVSGDKLLTEQLDFIQKISLDINKVTTLIAAK